ncbi:GNAT family N-acetyltransferase [Chitinophaga sp. RAB17]|uniref:GNAT family N-acetyltransferase n=1 Tax=Chitinophaga sp. RAB17 TaxID=3233049 RepID=UPI003F914E4D
MTIYPMTADHAASVLRIYEEGISTGNATFQTTAPSWEDWDKSHLTTCRMVAIENDEVIGWAALTSVSDRCVYAGVAEVSVYVALNANGKGVGKTLMQKLVEASEENGIWTLQAGIFPENTGSIKIHKANGFREVGRREKIGKMGDRWRDTLLLERRSTKAGI